MLNDKFRGLILDQKNGKLTREVREIDHAALPDGDVLIRVVYSSLNYKDAMILGGIGRLVRKYPHVPGIDFAGIVEKSQSERYKVGDAVLLTGWGVGETHWGGYAEVARVRSEWLIPLPEAFTMKQAMAIGTAGFTAMLAVVSLEQHGLHKSLVAKNESDSIDVLVTGASGGVGSVAVSILSKRGYQVSASTGRTEQEKYLRGLGATNILERGTLSEAIGRPLESERWFGAIDTVGGTTLNRIIAQLRYRASVAACGLVGGAQLETSVIPFLLRGVNLLGIDSSMQPYDQRILAWNRLVGDLELVKLEQATKVITLDEVPEYAERILVGGIRGRVVVEVNS